MLRKYSAVVCMACFCIMLLSCMKISPERLNGTVWESRKVDFDPGLGTEEVVITLAFHSEKVFSLKRTERWIKKRTGVTVPMPEDKTLSGEFKVDGTTIRLLWRDGSVLHLKYLDDRIYSPSGDKTFVRKK